MDLKREQQNNAHTKGKLKNILIFSSSELLSPFLQLSALLQDKHQVPQWILFPWSETPLVQGKGLQAWEGASQGCKCMVSSKSRGSHQPARISLSTSVPQSFQAQASWDLTLYSTPEQCQCNCTGKMRDELKTNLVPMISSLGSLKARCSEHLKLRRAM